MTDGSGRGLWRTSLICTPRPSASKPTCPPASPAWPTGRPATASSGWWNRRTPRAGGGSSSTIITAYDSWQERAERSARSARIVEMKVIESTEYIGTDRTLILHLPPDLSPGAYEVVIVLQPARVPGVPPVPYVEPLATEPPARPKGT